MKTQVLPANASTQFDAEVDVLVVGLGAAGAATALTAIATATRSIN